MSGGGGNQERWLLTYADLITLLMVFFIVMYAISEADKGKFMQLRSSVQRAFSIDTPSEPEPVKLKGGETSLLDAPGQKAPSNSAEGAASAPIVAGTPTKDEDGGVMFEQLRQAILSLAVSEGAADNVAVYVVPEGMVISLFGNLLFDSGRAELKPEGIVFLHSLAEVIRPWSNPLRIEGHTDNTPTNTPLYPSNWELSSARATLAARYLVEREKLAPERVTAVAYGEYRPFAANATREGRARNRRVDIVVLSASDTGR